MKTRKSAALRYSAFCPLSQHLAAVACTSLLLRSTLQVGVESCLRYRFKAHGRWINPLRADAHAADNLAEAASRPSQGVRALDLTGGGLKDAPVRKLGERLVCSTARVMLGTQDCGSKRAFMRKRMAATLRIGLCRSPHLEGEHYSHAAQSVMERDRQQRRHLSCG